MNLKSKFKYFAVSFLMMASTITPLGNFLVPSAAAAEDPTTTPSHGKTIKPNNDGTYTINLSVTGETSSSSTSNVTKANVVLVVDTSSSMVNNRPGGNGTPTRLALEQEVLTKDGGIIDNLLRQNVAGDPIKNDIIEVSIVDFGNKGKVSQSWTTDGVALKNTINSLSTTRGTNWEEGLRYAKSQADDIKARQPGEDVYVIFMTDGEPTTHYNSYTVNWQNIDTEWTAARDDARGIVATGYKFYALFTWGASNRERYLYSLVQYAYTGNNAVTSNTALDPAYAQYYTNATDTSTLIAALTQIVNDITTKVGYTGVEMTDGVTTMTASGVKANASGDVTGIKYYRKGGAYSTTANDGLGDEWTDAPKATINEDGEIDWDLGSMVLEDGVTYTISFVVWPKQESLDLVAELNNGVVKYENLTEEQKSQIAKSGDTYTLKTNTDFPTLTYQTVTTTTVNGQTTTTTSNPKTIDIDNPDPVGLYSEEILLQKLWEDSLDPSQREDDKEVQDVYLQLFKDGVEYDKFHENYDETHGGIRIKKIPGSNVWTSGSVAIAPGLMVSEGHPAFTEDAPYGIVTMNGKRYAILNQGHDYLFGEKDINNHFELTNYTYHPMLVDGELMNVLFTKSGDTITGVQSVKPMSTISATNTIKGGINIEKKVVDENNQPVTDAKDPFSIKVYLKNPDDSNYNYDYRIYYGQNNPKYNSPEEYSGSGEPRSGHKYGSGTIEETLYVGDTIRVVNVDTGVLYYVEEGTAPKGYTLDGIGYTIKYGTDNAKTDTVAKTDDGKDYYAVAGNSASAATITNKYVSGDLEISKAVSVTSGNATTAKQKEFTFKIKLYTDSTKATELTTPYKIDGKNQTIKSGDTFTLKDGESIKILKLPEGAYYEVTEEDCLGYAKTASNDTGTIVKNDTQKAAFTNTYSVSGKVKIEAKKDFNDWREGDKFIFKLTGDGINEAMEATIDGADKIAEFEVPINNIGTYEYVITEDLKGSNARGGIEQTSGSVAAHVTATDDGKGGLEFEVNYENGEGEKFNTIVNRYSAKGKIQLGASKILTGRDWKNGELYTFTLLDKDGKEIDSQDVSESKKDVVFSEISYTTEDAGKTFIYTIHESTPLPGGVTNSGDITATVTVEDNHDGTLKTTVVYSGGKGEKYNTIVNTYSAKGEFVFEATKELVGRKWANGESYSFVLKDEEGNVIDTQTVSKDGAISFKAVEFTQADAGEHKYTITETGTMPAGLSKSDDIKVTLTVSDDKEGHLSFNADYSNNGTITNTYKATGEVELEATKVLDGRVWRDGESFEFELSGDGIDAETVDVTEAKPTAKFKKISYSQADAGKTYSYLIKETTDLNGLSITNSGDITVTVKLTDDGEGNIVPDVTYSKSDKTIKNTYTAKGEVVLEAEKKLEGRAWKSGESFEFALKDADGKVIDTQTATKDGAISFKKIEYTKIGTYKYTIEETTAMPAGMSNSGKINVTVEVTDNYDGTLSASAAYEGDNKIIVNTYKATGEVALEATKALEGRDWLDGESFTFELFDKDNKSLGQKTVTKDSPKAVFDAIKYTEADIDAEYVYTIKEVGTLPNGVTSSGDLKVYVNVSDNGDGTLLADTDYVNGRTITNTYETKPVKIDVPFAVKKVIDDQSNSKKDATFKFELRDGDGNVIQTKEVTTSNLIGSVAFGAMEFDEAGEHEYTLVEVNDGQAGFSYDKTEHKVVVSVEDDYEKAQLFAKVTIDGKEVGEVEFKNIYKAEGTSAVIDIEKVLKGIDQSLAKEFEFILSNDDDDVQSIKIKGSGTAKFDELKFERVGSYTYTVKEVKGDAKGYSYDESEYVVTIDVTDDGGKLVAKISFKKDGVEAEAIVFNNSYKPEEVTYGCPECEVATAVKKVLENRELQDEEFKFEVYLDGELVTTGYNTADGDIVFEDAITFETAGSYSFTIKEILDDREQDVTYDENEYEFVIVVEDDGEGKLKISSDTSEDVVFTNKYNEPGKGGTPPKPVNPVTHDDVMASVATLAISLIGLMGSLVAGKRYLKK